MSKTLSFAGWKPGNPEQIIQWKEKFEESYSGEGQLTLLSKETYKAEADDDMPAFEYRYLIKSNGSAGIWIRSEDNLFPLIYVSITQVLETRCIKGSSRRS